MIFFSLSFSLHVIRQYTHTHKISHNMKQDKRDQMRESNGEMKKKWTKDKKTRYDENTTSLHKWAMYSIQLHFGSKSMRERASDWKENEKHLKMCESKRELVNGIPITAIRLNTGNQIARHFVCYFEMRNVHQLEMNDVCEFVYFLWDRFIPNPNQSMHKWLHYSVVW